MRSVDHETEASDLLHCKPESVDAGSLKQGDSLQTIAQLFDRRLPDGSLYVPEFGGLSRVARDDLSQPLYPGAWRAEEGAS